MVDGVEAQLETLTPQDGDVLVVRVEHAISTQELTRHLEATKQWCEYYQERTGRVIVPLVTYDDAKISLLRATETQTREGDAKEMSTQGLVGELRERVNDKRIVALVSELAKRGCASSFKFRCAEYYDSGYPVDPGIDVRALLSL